MREISSGMILLHLPGSKVGAPLSTSRRGMRQWNSVAVKKRISTVSSGACVLNPSLECDDDTLTMATLGNSAAIELVVCSASCF